MIHYKSQNIIPVRTVFVVIVTLVFTLFLRENSNS